MLNVDLTDQSVNNTKYSIFLFFEIIMYMNLIKKKTFILHDFYNFSHISPVNCYWFLACDVKTCINKITIVLSGNVKIFVYAIMQNYTSYFH